MAAVKEKHVEWFERHALPAAWSTLHSGGAGVSKRRRLYCEEYGMQGRHTTPESFGVQALQSASHESWIYDHCSAVHSLTALAFVSSMSEPLRIKTCCSSVGVHHTAATSSNDHSGMMLPSLHAESHGLSRFVMVRLSWHNKHRHVAQRVGSTYEASHPTERRCSSGKDKEAVPENGFKKWRMNNVPVTSD